MASESGDSARARLIRTRRGTKIDESLLPEARRECLKILREAARKAVGEDAYLPGLISDACESVHSNAEAISSERLWDFFFYRMRSIDSKYAGQGTHVVEEAASRRKPIPKSNPTLITEKELLDLVLDELDRHGVLDSIFEMDFVSGGALEEWEAEELAREARATVRRCGGCGRELPSPEPAYYGAEVYVGMMPLDWDRVSKPRVCKLRYERTVLCGSCAPEWLFPDREDVVTQLCAHCERPMISRLKLSELQRTLCSDPCRRAYQNRVRREKRAEGRKKICELCGEEFPATRRDAKMCSAGCKQQAYRRRNKEVPQNR